MTEEQTTTKVPAALAAGSDDPVSREALYEMVWSEPMLRVAAQFGVSSSYMARICTLLNVPRPERGYWAKLAVGKAPKRPPLPEPRPGDPLEWTRDGALPKRARSLPKPPDQRPRRKRTARRQLPDRHPLVSGAKPLFETGRLSWRTQYLKPTKRLLVDLAVTKTGLDKAIAGKAHCSSMPDACIGNTPTRPTFGSSISSTPATPHCSECGRNASAATAQWDTVLRNPRLESIRNLRILSR